MALLFVFVVIAVVAITKGQRRIPTQSAKARPRPAASTVARGSFPAAARQTKPASCR